MSTVPDLPVAASAVAVAVAVSMQTQRVNKETPRRPTVRDAEGPFIIHFLNTGALKEQLKLV
jgi:hypothetical protein